MVALRRCVLLLALVVLPSCPGSSPPADLAPAAARDAAVGDGPERLRLLGGVEAAPRDLGALSSNPDLRHHGFGFLTTPLQLQVGGTVQSGISQLNFDSTFTTATSGAQLTVTSPVTGVTAGGGITSSGGAAPNLTLGGTANQTLSTGSITWSGVSGKTVSIAATAGSITLQGSGTSQGQLILDSGSARMKWGGTNAVRVDATNLSIDGTGQSLTYNLSTGVFAPVTDAGPVLGTSSLRWGQSYFRRLSLEGTAPTSAAFQLSAGWGGTASVGSITGSDSNFTFTVTSAGAGQGSNPTITYTFKDGTWTQTPTCFAKYESTNDAGLGVRVNDVTESTNATTLTLTFNTSAAVTVADTYTFTVLCFGG